MRINFYKEEGMRFVTYSSRGPFETKQEVYDFIFSDNGTEKMRKNVKSLLAGKAVWQSSDRFVVLED